MARPTQGEMFANALDELDAASNALTKTRAWLNADWAGLEDGVELPRVVGQRRSRAREAITKAKAEIETARRELDEALRTYDPAESELFDGPDTGIVDEAGR